MKKKIVICLSSLCFMLMISMFFCLQQVNAANGKTYALLISGAGSITDPDVPNMIDRINSNRLEQYPGKPVYTTLNFNKSEAGAGTSVKELENYIKTAYKNATENDLAIFFYSGHGTQKNGKGVGIAISEKYYYSYKGLAQLLSQSIKCKKIIVVMNACYSGGFYDSGISQLADRSRFIAFLSSQSWQASQVNTDVNMSRFSRAFVNGLGFSSKKVYADFNNDGKVTVQEMKTYLDIQLRAELIDDDWNDQNPICYTTDNNYVIYQYNNASSSKSLVINKTALELWKGQSITLNAAKKNISGTLKWTTSNSKVATVSSKGKITAKGVGKATIKVTAGGISKTCKVTVKKPVIKLNKSKLTIKLGSSGRTQLKASVKGASKTVKWKSSNTKIATVSKKGVIKPKINGKVTISATANGVTAKCLVTIKPSIKLNKTTVTLRPKQTYQLKATVKGKKGRLKWASSNQKVVSVNSKGKITAKKTGTANITVTVNGVKSVCKVTVANSSASLVNLKSLRGKNYSYKNSKFSFGIGFAKSSDYVYIGVWNVSGTSSSYEDFLFKLKEGTYRYRPKGMRSHYIYDITIKPYKDYIKISLKCQNSSYSYFNISGQKFKKTTQSTCSHYAELFSIVEIKNYLHGAGGPNTVYYTQQLVNAIGGMKTGRNAKYPDLYFTGNNMVIGVNNNPAFNTSKDEYVRIENNGNTAVLFYGAKIGDTRSEMESKFAKYNIKTWDNGKTYSNANGWELKVTFQSGKLKKYIYLCKPTS